MKFAIINDIHFGPPESGYEKGVQRKLVFKAENLIKKFIDKMNNQAHPEFVINLGDSIEDVNNQAVDVQSFKKVLTLLSPLQMPVYTLIGNHDVRTLKAKEIADMLGYKQMYYSFDYDSYHFIALSFQIIGDHTHKLADIDAIVPEEQIEWLENDLAKTNKPTIIFSHYGLAEDDMKGNFWFESESHYALIQNRLEVRKILEKSGRVKAVISGHQHWNRMHVHNNIPYFTVTSLIENFNNDGVAAEAYTIVNLNREQITVDVQGNDPAKFSFNLWQKNPLRHYPKPC